MATLRKRGDRWQVQIRLQGHTPVTRSFLTKVEGEAWAKQTETRLERSTGTIDLRTLDRTTFGDLLTRYQREVTPKKRGAEVESMRLGCMAKLPMALLPLSKVSGGIIAAYCDQRLLKVSGETVRRELTILHHVIQIAQREWDIPFASNPVSLVKRPVPSRSRERRKRGLKAAVRRLGRPAGRRRLSSSRA